MEAGLARGGVTPLGCPTPPGHGGEWALACRSCGTGLHGACPWFLARRASAALQVCSSTWLFVTV